MLTDNMKGALIMALSMAFFTLNDTFMKLMAGEVPLYQILTLRNGAVTIVYLIVAWKTGAFARGMDARDWKLSLLRGAAETAAAYFFLNALFNMPLANVTAVLQSAPLVVMVAAALVLKERIGWRRVSAALIGFLGVLLIVRPGPDGFNIFAGYTLVAVLCVTARDITTRKLSRAAPTVLVTLITSAMILVFYGILGLFEGWVPLDARTASLTGAATVMILGAYLASVQAMRIGEVSFVSPFRYMSLLWGLVLGYAVFGDWPTGLTLLGAAIVVGSGLYSFYRELQTRRRASVAAIR